MTQKTCPWCEETKPLDEFYRNRAAPDGRTSVCAVCQQERLQERYHNDPAQRRRQQEYSRTRYHQQVAQIKAGTARGGILRQINSRAHNSWVRNLRSVYGITPADYDQMYEAQNGVCTICAWPERAKYKGTLKRLAVDHDHRTGKVRALLCNGCNRALDLLEDRPWHEAAHAYLTQHAND